MAIGYTV